MPKPIGKRSRQKQNNNLSKESLNASYVIYTRRVAGLREGCLLYLEDRQLQLIGHKSLRLFRFDEVPWEMEPGSDLSFLL